MARGPPWERDPLALQALPGLASMLDAASTTMGLALGLQELGPVASGMLEALGPLYWGVQVLLLYTLSLALRLWGEAALGGPGWWPLVAYTAPSAPVLVAGVGNFLVAGGALGLW